MEAEKERIAELIRQIQSGSKEAFGELYKLTAPRAYFVALEITKNEHDAEDILQESYIKALEKIDEIDPERNFLGWFYQVVANKSKDFLKGKKAILFDGEEEEIFESIPDDDVQFSPEESLNQDELRREVMEAIDELTAEKRACVMMMYFGEMSVNEIANSLEVPVSTVKNRLFTARKDLKNKFEKRGITSLYSAAPIGVVVWALGKTSEAVSTTFAASVASAEVLAGINAAGSGIATAAAGTTAASGAAASAAGGAAAKIAALSVAQKVVAGVVATGVITGSAVGVTTVVKNNIMSETTTAYVEEVTTAPSFETEFVPVIAPTQAETTVSDSTEVSTAKREPTATASKSAETTAQQTAASTAAKTSKATTTRRNYFPNKTTTEKITSTTIVSATKQTTTESTTEKKTTTTKKETTEAATTVKAATTVQPSTTQPTTTESTTQAPATLIIEITDLDESVVDTLNLTVPAGTEMTWDYLINLIKANGYETMAGVYGDAVDTTAEAGMTYNFTAEL